MCRCAGVWLKMYARDSLSDTVSHEGREVDDTRCLTGRAMMISIERSLVIAIVPDML